MGWRGGEGFHGGGGRCWKGRGGGEGEVKWVAWRRASAPSAVVQRTMGGQPADILPSAVESQRRGSDCSRRCCAVLCVWPEQQDAVTGRSMQGGRACADTEGEGTCGGGCQGGGWWLLRCCPM